MERITRNSKPRRKKLLKSTTIFVILMLLYPVLHFLLMWIGVNLNSILLVFKSPYRGKLEWNTDHNYSLFYNFETLFESLKTPSYQKMFLASASYSLINVFIILPLALIFSYFIFKKIYMNGFFKIIFYLPSILPLVVLTLAYKIFLSANGPLGKIVGVETAQALFIGDSSQWMIWIFCIWAGIGYDVILLTSGMSRIPRDLLEQSKMDAVPPLTEFVRVVIPLTWPTISTLLILGLMAVFSIYLQPKFLTSGQYDTMTIGLQIYQASGGAALNTPATLGLFLSVIGAPIILGIRSLLNRCFKDVSF